MNETSTKQVDELFTKLTKKYSKKDKNILQKAFDMASAGHINQKRDSGEPYITHPLHVAIYLSELSMDLETIVSAILHDLIEDTDITYNDLKKEFGKEIADIVDGVTKLDKINYNSKEEAKADAIRKMVIAMSKDIRVLILKLADRLHNIETIDYLNEWKKDLRECCKLDPEHISAYCLTYEQGTPIVEMTDSGTLQKLSEEDELKMYEFTNDFLRDNDYNHYEISNFAKQDKECLHNTVYWENREYIGIGAGAFSYVNGERYCNIKNVKEYTSSSISKKRLICFSEKLPQKQRASEILIMALRMTSGISKKEFTKRSGFDLNELFEKQLNNLTQAGLINFDNERVKLTTKGLSVADSVMMEFV